MIRGKSVQIVKISTVFLVAPFFRQIAQKTYRLAIEFSTYKEQKTAPKKGLFQLVFDRICHINNVRKNKQTLQIKEKKGF